MSVPIPICRTMRFKAMPVLSSLEMGSRVRSIVNRKEARGLDRGVALCSREAGVAQQLLDGAQIAAGSEQVGCKTVAEGVRGRGFRQAEETAQRRHLSLHNPRIERPAAAADKER